MSNVNLLAAALLALGLTQQTAHAQSDAPDQEIVQDDNGEATDGTGTRVWPDIADLFEQLFTPTEDR
ncbi:MAG: hypothetical protein AAF610_14745 [Pseudomonadota bacterium]